MFTVSLCRFRVRWNDRCNERFALWSGGRADTEGASLNFSTQEWIMARCKQSSTRPPNCNFLCLILVTEWKKFNVYIYFLHSSPFYFFEKLLTIPSFFFFLPLCSLFFYIFGRADCFELEEIELSSLEKNFDFFFSFVQLLFLQLQFSSYLNYFRIIF